MGDFGLKISQVGEDVNTSSLSETSFDSRYASFMLLEKKTFSWTADKGVTGDSGTESYSHGLGYTPFCIGFLDSFNTQSTNYPGPYLLPHDESVPTRGGTDLYITIDPYSKESSIELEWTVSEYNAGSPVPLTDDVDIECTMHIYAYKLGYETD